MPDPTAQHAMLQTDAMAASAATTTSALTETMSNLASLKLTEIDSAGWMLVAEHYGIRVAFVLILMFLAWTASGWASSAVRTSLARLRFDATLTKFIAKFVRWGVLSLAGLMCLSKFGVETTSFAAVIGAAGLAIGLAFQGTLSNFAAGAMLLIFRPYKVGDVINVSGFLGSVDEVELFTTTLDTFDNRRIIVPNSEIFGAVIENVTHHAHRRVDVEVGVCYTADIDHTRDVLLQAIASVPEVLHDPEPAAVLTGLGASSVDWSVRAWAPTPVFGAVKQALIRAVKMHLDAAEIGIPFPQLDVHIPQPPAAAQRLAG